MATEASELFYKFYPDFGKFIIILDDKDPINAIINNDSEVNKPNFLLYNDFIDRFNQEIYPKYLEFEKISFRYFGDVISQNKMTAFITQVLVELRVYAKNKHKKINSINVSSNKAVDIFDNLDAMMFDFENLLNTHMDKLILKYIKNYDEKITNLSEFNSKYADINSYMRAMISKVIENID